MGLLESITSRFAGKQSPLLHIALDEGEGPVVVLIHGIASSAATFDKVVPLLKDRHRCIAIELLGFGSSPAPDDCDYTIEDHVKALHATIRSLDLKEPFTLVGHSLGGLIAPRFAAKYPGMVSHLVLVSPPVYLSPTELGDPLVRAQVGGYLKAYEFLRANKDFTIANAALIGKLLQITAFFDISERTWTPFIKSLRNCIESQTTISDIAAVKAPIDVVYGGMDQFLVVGTLRIIGQMRHVTMHRVEVNDHVIRPRLAKVVAAAVG